MGSLTVLADLMPAMTSILFVRSCRLPLIVCKLPLIVVTILVSFSIMVCSSLKKTSVVGWVMVKKHGAWEGLWIGAVEGRNLGSEYQMI
jgi:hypothetical protein